MADAPHRKRTERTSMAHLLTLAGRGLQLALWIVLLGFVGLVGMSRVTRFEALVVRSGSMDPTIAIGSIVIVDRSARSPAVGAIVSFREPDGSVVTHRIVGIQGGQFVTRGDANRSPDAIRRPAASIYGAVVLSLPYAGYAVHALQQPAVFLLLLLGSGGLIVLGALRTIYREVIRLAHHEGPINEG
jgi:signal peptidase